MQSTVAVDGFLNHLQLERHPKFPLFPTLPNELQHMVWKEATRDDGYGEYKRMVEIRYEAANLRPYTRSVIPDGIKVLLSTCRASNKAANEEYPHRFQVSGSSGFRFSSYNDTLFLAVEYVLVPILFVQAARTWIEVGWDTEKSSDALVPLMSDGDLKSVWRLAVDDDLYNILRDRLAAEKQAMQRRGFPEHQLQMEAIPAFKNLESLAIVTCYTSGPWDEDFFCAPGCRCPGCSLELWKMWDNDNAIWEALDDNEEPDWRGMLELMDRIDLQNIREIDPEFKVPELEYVMKHPAGDWAIPNWARR